MLDTSLTTAPDTSAATAAQVWAHLGNAIDTEPLPSPSMVDVNPDRWAATIWLQRHSHNIADLHAWVAFLGAGETTTRIYDSPDQPGRILRDTSAAGRRRSWTFEVRLLEALPIESVAVAYGPTGGAS